MLLRDANNQMKLSVELGIIILQVSAAGGLGVKVELLGLSTLKSINANAAMQIILIYNLPVSERSAILAGSEEKTHSKLNQASGANDA